MLLSAGATRLEWATCRIVEGLCGIVKGLCGIVEGLYGIVEGLCRIVEGLCRGRKLAKLLILLGSWGFSSARPGKKCRSPAKNARSVPMRDLDA